MSIYYKKHIVFLKSLSLGMLDFHHLMKKQGIPIGLSKRISLRYGCSDSGDASTIVFVEGVSWRGI